MKQTYCLYYCKFHKRNIGEGLCCFECANIERPNDNSTHQMCKHEKKIKELVRDI